MLWKVCTLHAMRKILGQTRRFDRAELLTELKRWKRIGQALEDGSATNARQ